MTYLDTHVVIRLYEGRDAELPETTRERIDSDELRISPMVGLELSYLHEIGRISTEAGSIIDDLSGRIGLTVCDWPFRVVAAMARLQTWTRDPFDRVITGQAAANGSTLITKDQLIRANYPGALWD